MNFTISIFVHDFILWVTWFGIFVSFWSEFGFTSGNCFVCFDIFFSFNGFLFSFNLWVLKNFLNFPWRICLKIFLVWNNIIRVNHMLGDFLSFNNRLILRCMFIMIDGRSDFFLANRGCNDFFSSLIYRFLRSWFALDRFSFVSFHLLRIFLWRF